MLQNKIKEAAGIVTAFGVLITALMKEAYIVSILDFLGNHKQHSFHFIIVLVMITLIFLFYRMFKNTVNLREHNFFDQMKFYIDYNIVELESDLDKNRVVFTDMMKIKFEFWIAHTRLLVDAYYHNKINKKNLDVYIQNWLIDGVKEQNVLFDHNNIPLIVQEIFNKWHKRRVKLFMSFINKISKSNNTLYALNSTLTFLDNLFDETISDAETSIYTLNGDLVNIEYHRIIGGINEKITL